VASLVSNIGAGGRQRRYVIAGVCLLAAVAVGAALLGTGAARGFRVWLLIPLWGAALGFFQARGGT
jgi:hypothetical protein